MCSFCAALAWRRHTGARRRQVQRVLTPLVFGLAHLCLKHPSVAASYSNIELVYDSQGRYEEALVQYQQALEVFLAVFGSKHPFVADTKENIGLVYAKTGKKSEAKTMFTEPTAEWALASSLVGWESMKRR